MPEVARAGYAGMGERRSRPMPELIKDSSEGERAAASLQEVWQIAAARFFELPLFLLSPATLFFAQGHV